MPKGKERGAHRQSTSAVPTSSRLLAVSVDHPSSSSPSSPPATPPRCHESERECGWAALPFVRTICNGKSCCRNDACIIAAGFVGQGERGARDRRWEGLYMIMHAKTGEGDSVDRVDRLALGED